ncbi:fungal-specific transcription factor domain-containing protein [Aspergillus crustosus]
MDSGQRHCRTRDGCWTCRNRKKKCGDKAVPCANCNRLGLQCQRDIRLVWEDDTRRDGMKRRGRARNLGSNSPQYKPHSLGICGLSTWPYELDPTESLLLDHYIQRFSRTYPTFSGPTSPFLTVFIPLSTRSRVVLDALLALSGVQSWENGSFGMEEGMLKLRQNALRGCRQLLRQLDLSPDVNEPYTELSTQTANDDMINLFASCMLLLLYEKLAGEGPDNWSPHLSFIAQICARAGFQFIRASASAPGMVSWDEVLRFLLNLFLYNDLVRSTSLHTATLSDFYVRDMFPSRNQMHTGLSTDRFIFPRLIARISAADKTVTDAEIIAWDGSLNWLPSFSLVSSEKLQHRVLFDECLLAMDPHCHRIEDLILPSELTDQKLASRLYRIAALIYRRQRAEEGWNVLEHETTPCTARPSHTLALWAVQLVQLLPRDSAYENTLIWPIGIVARELTVRDDLERGYIISRLQALERHFQMKHFSCVRDHLSNFWMATDQGINHNYNMILLG